MRRLTDSSADQSQTDRDAEESYQENEESPIH